MKFASRLSVCLALICIGGLSSALFAQGIVLPGVGPVNRSMGGAATAAPLDATGALRWNSATITGLNRSEFDVSLEFLYPRTQVSSAIPAFQMAGSTESDSGVNVLPNVALVYQPEASRWTYGLGLYSVGGFGTNFAGSQLGAPGANPIFTPPSEPLAPGLATGVGVGALYTRMQLLQLAPTAAVRLTDHLSIGFSPTVDVADIALDPNLLAGRAETGTGMYPGGSQTRSHWGLGFQVGMYLTTESAWNFGASYQSKQWFETFEFPFQAANGAARTFALDADFPSIVSLGASYVGFDRWMFATDVRYIDFAGTGTFGDEAGVTSTGALTGLGWRSVWLFCVGSQYQLSDYCQLRAGYTYNTNPIPSEATAANAGTPIIYQHAVYCGLSRHLTSNMLLALTYYRTLDATLTGPYPDPTLASLGSTVTIRQTIDALAAGLQLNF